DVPGCGQRSSEPKMRQRKTRTKRDRAAIAFYGRLPVAEFAERGRQAGQRLGKMRVEGECLAIGRHCFLAASAAQVCVAEIAVAARPRRIKQGRAPVRFYRLSQLTERVQSVASVQLRAGEARREAGRLVVTRESLRETLRILERLTLRNQLRRV